MCRVRVGQRYKTASASRGVWDVPLGPGAPALHFPPNPTCRKTPTAETPASGTRAWYFQPGNLESLTRDLGPYSRETWREQPAWARACVTVLQPVAGPFVRCFGPADSERAALALAVVLWKLSFERPLLVSAFLWCRLSPGSRPRPPFRPAGGSAPACRGTGLSAQLPCSAGSPETGWSRRSGAPSPPAACPDHGAWPLRGELGRKQITMAQVVPPATSQGSVRKQVPCLCSLELR